MIAIYHIDYDAAISSARVELAALRRIARTINRPRSLPKVRRVRSETSHVGKALIDIARNAISDCGGNITKAAKEIGVNKTTIYRWKKRGIIT